MKKIDVIGCGPTGLVLSNFLARNGKDVTLYEKRAQGEITTSKNDKSINLTLSERGLRALDELGLKEKALEKAVPLHGRQIHVVGRKQNIQYYGSDAEEPRIFCVRRHDLINVLVKDLQENSSVNLKFGHEFLKLNKRENQFLCRNRKTGEETWNELDLVVGADGSFSRVRQEMMIGEPLSFNQKFFDWSYIQFSIPNAQFQAKKSLDSRLIHFWPRPGALSFLLPNLDGTLAGNIFLKRDGNLSFEDLRNSSRFEEFMKLNIPELLPFRESLFEQVQNNEEAFIVCNHLSKWHYEDKVMLLGDSCHATYHFYGQGLNCNLEDCLHFKDILLAEGQPDLKQEFAQFQSSRKPTSDLLRNLSEKQFFFLKDKSSTPFFLAQNHSMRVFNRLMPGMESEYDLVTTGRMSLPNAEKQIAHQRKLFWGLGGAVLFAGYFGYYFVMKHLYSLFSSPKIDQKQTKKSPVHQHQM